MLLLEVFIELVSFIFLWSVMLCFVIFFFVVDILIFCDWRGFVLIDSD